MLNLVESKEVSAPDLRWPKEASDLNQRTFDLARMYVLVYEP